MLTAWTFSLAIFSATVTWSVVQRVKRQIGDRAFSVAVLRPMKSAVDSTDTCIRPPLPEDLKLLMRYALPVTG